MRKARRSPNLHGDQLHSAHESPLPRSPCLPGCPHGPRPQCLQEVGMMLRESGHRKPRPLPASLRPGGGLEPCRTAKDPTPPAAHPPGWVASLSVSITANAPHETASWSWHLYPQPHPHRVEISTRFFTRRAPFLTLRSKRLRQGFSAVFVHPRALQSTRRRMSFLPPHLQAAAPPKRCRAFTFTSPLASQSPLKDGTSRNCLFHHILERMRLREAK